MPPKKPEKLSRTRIVTAALAVADEAGLAGVTTRAIAARLGVTPMALYRHVDGIETVHRGMVELVLANSHLFDHATAALELWLVESFERIHAILLAHPNVLPLWGSSVSDGPEALGVADTVLGRLVASGYTSDEAVAIFYPILSYTLGSATIEAAARATRAKTDASGAQREPQDFTGFPHLRAALPTLARFTMGKAFTHGLSAIVRASLSGKSD